MDLFIAYFKLFCCLGKGLQVFLCAYVKEIEIRTKLSSSVTNISIDRWFTATVLENKN